MSDTQQPTPPGGFQPGIETIEGYHGFAPIPEPVNPLQAQTAFESRARIEDWVAHIIAIIMTSGFFMLAFAVLLGFVNISNAATATMVGTILGYAVGKVDPILVRYFHLRGQKIAETNTAQSSQNATTTAATAAPSAAATSTST
jgi:hypothetical protein